MGPGAAHSSLETLPVDVLVYLLGSRYCETDRLISFAWSRFGKVRKGWPLVQAICDYVHDSMSFGYEHASRTRTAWDPHNRQCGVGRRFPHLPAPLCRSLTIPPPHSPSFPPPIPTP